MSSNGLNNASLTSTTYQHVNHKKIEGTMILTNSTITFYPISKAETMRSVSNSWNSVSKHQVSPASHRKYLLKITLSSQTSTPSPSSPSLSITFQLKTREDLERIRKDVSKRLTECRRILAQNATPTPDSRKRSIHDTYKLPTSSQQTQNPALRTVSNQKNTDLCNEELPSTSFTTFYPTTTAVTRSCILSSNPALRLQHSILTQNQNISKTNTNTGNQSPLMSEKDFWSAHSQTTAATESALHGLTSKGQPSTLKSSLNLLTGKIKIGVEEMRQVFILYPAVHKAYEEKVPLDMSEELFWRKYLESEYFHRDRGRLGSHIGRMCKNERLEKQKSDKSKADKNNANASGSAVKEKDDADKVNAVEEDKMKNNEREENARVAAASADDIFSRVDVELSKKDSGSNNSNKVEIGCGIGVNSAVGQFDLTATANTERGGKVLLNAQDLHPDGSDSRSKGSLVINKYNRHWAMVLNPGEATAGCDLMTLAQKSKSKYLRGDEDAKFAGGVGREMERLVGFANAEGEMVNHVKGIGHDDINYDNEDETGEINYDCFKELNLNNIDAYSCSASVKKITNFSDLEKKAEFSKYMAKEMMVMINPILKNQSIHRNEDSFFSTSAFPSPKLGRMILEKMTVKMAQDSETEANVLKMVNDLPDSFKKRLSHYFLRSSELLRHFFALRNVIEEAKHNNNGASEGSSTKKLKKIAKGIESVHGEIRAMREEPHTAKVETMRRLCLSIEEQLSSAIQLHQSIGGGGFGFVQVSH